MKALGEIQAAMVAESKGPGRCVVCDGVIQRTRKNASGWTCRNEECNEIWDYARAADAKRASRKEAR